MSAGHSLEFSYTGPAVMGEAVEFRGIHHHAGCDIHVAAGSPVDRSKIDTSASDVVITYPIDSVDFTIDEGGEERIDLTMTRTETQVHTQHPRADHNDYQPQIDRCRELANVLFDKGLTVT